MERRIEIEIANVGARQRGNISRAQLRALGLGKTAIDRRVARGLLHVVYPGVYAVGCPPTDEFQFASAALLACGDGAVLSHGSAAALWAS